MRPPRQLGDRVMRDTLRDPANLRDFLRACVPDLADQFDFAAIEDVSRDFFTDDWRGREADVLCVIPLRQETGTTPVLVCVMIEHQTQDDPVSAFRTLFNLAGFWDRHWRAWEGRDTPRGPLTLLPVLPIILYTGQGPWGATRTVRDLVTGPETLRLLAPDWGPIYWELAGHTADSLLAGGLWMQFLAVMRVTAGERDELERVLRAVVSRLDAARAPDHVRSLEVLRAALLYVMQRRGDIPRDEIRVLVEQNSHTRRQEAGDMARSMLDITEQEGMVRMIRRLMERKFGPVPQAVTQRIEAIQDTDLLLALGDRLIEAKSINDLFSEGDAPPPP